MVGRLGESLAVPPLSQFGGPSRYAFSYDNLYRLTAVKGVYLTNPSRTRIPSKASNGSNRVQLLAACLSRIDES